MNQRSRLQRRPEARSYTVEALLQLVRDGRLRVPEFQRPLRWSPQDVLDLFDSAYRGFPVGELLLSRGQAPAGLLTFGPLTIRGPLMPDALHVVDGQQRVTALAGALLHPESIPRGDAYAVWFDLENETFNRLIRPQPPEHWIPLNVVSDSFLQLQWLNAWPYRETRPDLVKRALELGKAVREYQIPAYVVEGASEAELRLIFKRVNTAGVQLEENEVFDALFGTGANKPIEAACRRLESDVPFGPIDRELFLRCLKVVAGLPASHDFDSTEFPGIGEQPVRQTELALRRVLEFLIGDVGILHSSLLPYRLPLIVLARFFHLVPAPRPRDRALLARWVWRGALSREHASSSNAVVERLSGFIQENDGSGSAHRLISSTSTQLEVPSSMSVWNGRHAETRLCALGLVFQRPRDPGTGEPFQRARLGEKLQQSGLARTFVDLMPEPAAGPSCIVHRVLLVEPSSKLLIDNANDEVLSSHLLDRASLEALARGDRHTFESRRAPLMDSAFHSFFTSRAAVSDLDRPPIDEIKRKVDEVLSRR